MSFSEPFDDRMAELAAAADRALPSARQAAVEADPELAAALAEQRRAASLIRAAAAEVRASPALRERLRAID